MGVCLELVFSIVVPELAQAVTKNKKANRFMRASSRGRTVGSPAPTLKMEGGPVVENPYGKIRWTIGSMTSIQLAYIFADGCNPSPAASDGSLATRRDGRVMSA
jgi:hypothetical protein